MTLFVSETEPQKPGQPDVAVLEDHTPEQARCTRATALFTAILGGLFLILNYIPLCHTDLWGHLAYGRWIAKTHQVPTTEPLVPLCQGVPYVDTEWLSQYLGYKIFAGMNRNPAGLQFAYALSITICNVLLVAALRRRTGTYLAPLVGLAVFLAVNREQLGIIRPQLAGLVCYCLLFCLITARQFHKAYWVLIPVLFALWANLHGSFLMGIMLLGLFAIGRAIDLIRRVGSLSSLWRDGEFRRYFLLTQLSIVAALLNPYGALLYVEIFRIADNPNVLELKEWLPLTIQMKQGKAAALATLLLMALYRWSPRRITGPEALTLVVFGAATLATSRIIVWWAPVVAYYIGLHVAAIRQRKHPPQSSPRTGLSTVMVLGLLWIAFAYTPLGITLVKGPPEKAKLAEVLQRAVSRSTPRSAANYLWNNPPQGLVFNILEMGDFLLYYGPPKISLFCASHVHLLPPEVWQDYNLISEAGAGWENRLNRYGANTVVLDRAPQREAITKALRDDSDWELLLEDSDTVIFGRKQIPGAPAQGAAPAEKKAEAH